MTRLSLGQAAKLAGVGKSTIARAIKAGRLSAQRRDDGSYEIDVAELHRVYPVTPETGAAPSGVVRHTTATRDGGDTPDTPADTAALRAQIDGLREALRRADLRADELRLERDKWQEQASRALADHRPWWRRLAG
jgi:hypothetical protein